jgi:hypothetical protein
VAGVLRLTLQYLTDHLLHLLITDSTGATLALLIVQAWQSPFRKTYPPAGYDVLADTQSKGDGVARLALCKRKDDFGTNASILSPLTLLNAAEKLCFIGFGQENYSPWSAHINAQLSTSWFQ